MGPKEDISCLLIANRVWGFRSRSWKQMSILARNASWERTEAPEIKDQNSRSRESKPVPCQETEVKKNQ